MLNWLDTEICEHVLEWIRYSRLIVPSPQHAITFNDKKMIDHKAPKPELANFIWGQWIDYISTTSNSQVPGTRKPRKQRYQLRDLLKSLSILR